MTEEAVQFEARGAIRKLLGCHDPEVLVEGPAGTGKTMGVLTKCDLLAWQYPGCRILLVRATRASLTQSVLVTYESKVLLPGYGVHDGARRDSRSSYRYPNGSEVVCGGLDNADRIMSTEYDVVAAFEATEITEDSWEKLTTRLRNNVIPYQQAIADCNPGPPSHWLNKRASAGKMTRLLSRHEDNPWLHDGQGWTLDGLVYIQRLQRLAGVRRARLAEGRWAQADGMVYDNWDQAVHVIDQMPKGWQSWPRYRVIDFGYTNPFVCQWWAMDPDGRLYLYREHYHTKRIVSDWATIIKRYPEPIVATVTDHDAEDRATLEAAGILTVPATKEVSAGIQAVASRLSLQADGRPRLYVVRGCLAERDASRDDARHPCGFLEEVDGYAWQPVREGKQAKEEPVKEHDHSCDAVRYMVMHFDAQQERSGVVLVGAEPWSDLGWR